MFTMLIVITSWAKDIREIWLTMPDSLVTYLDKNKRIEMVDYIDMQVRADVKNALEGVSVMDTLTHDFLQVTLNEVCTLQMRTLSTELGDTVFCLVKTFRGPQAESEATIYNTNWQKIKNISLPLPYLSKPDTMSTTKPNIVSAARVPDRPYNVNYTKVYLFGFAAGALLWNLHSSPTPPSLPQEENTC